MDIWDDEYGPGNPTDRIAELKAENERQRELMRGMYEMLMDGEGYCHHAQRPFMNKVKAALEGEQDG